LNGTILVEIEESFDKLDKIMKKQFTREHGMEHGYLVELRKMAAPHVLHETNFLIDDGMSLNWHVLYNSPRLVIKTHS
jgi:hypothetical protein